MGERFDLEWREAGGLSWLQWEGAGVAAAFPTRAGGVSPAPYESLNLGLSTGDEPGNVLENRGRFCAALDVPQERLVVPGQVHGTTLAWVGETEAGRGAFDRTTVIHDHDGLLTAAPGLGLGVSYADCVPVVIVARGADGPEFAAVHAGWRGMLACSAPSSAPASVPAASPSTRACGNASRNAFRVPPPSAPRICGSARAATWRPPAYRRRP